MTEGRQSQRLPSRAPFGLHSGSIRAPFGLHSGSIRVSRAVVPTQTLTKNSKRLEETHWEEGDDPTRGRLTLSHHITHSSLTRERNEIEQSGTKCEEEGARSWRVEPPWNDSTP